MNRKKILINDNEPSEVAELRKSLVTVGYDVRLVASSAEALSLLDGFRPHLIICEARLPEMDGPQLLQEIRKNPALQRLPFVLTGKLKNIDERLAVMKLALDDYWQKPIEAAEAVVRAEMLIKDAELLSALQFVLNRMSRRTWPGVPRIDLECNGGASRRDEDVVALPLDSFRAGQAVQPRHRADTGASVVPPAR